jgi:hypothetical protein
MGAYAKGGSCSAARAVLVRLGPSRIPSSRSKLAGLELLRVAKHVQQHLVELLVHPWVVMNLTRRSKNRREKRASPTTPQRNLVDPPQLTESVNTDFRSVPSRSLYSRVAKPSVKYAKSMYSHPAV